MKSILLVDDQPNIRQLLKFCLRAEDRQILEAENGERAIEIAHDKKPDLIIMDLVMPGGMDGFKATEILKSDPETRKCPILILTARDQVAVRERAYEIGASDYMGKPFSLESLQRKVEGMLEGAEG